MAASIGRPNSVVAAGRVVYIAATTTDPGAQVRRVAADGTISTVVSDAGGIQHLTGGPGGSMYFIEANSVIMQWTPGSSPVSVAHLPDIVGGLAVLPTGQLLASLPNSHVVVAVNPVDASVTTVAGTGDSGSSGDGGPAAAADLIMPLGVAVGPDAAVYIADAAAYRIRRIDPTTGIITTIAGTGQPGSDGDGGPATAATVEANFGLVAGPDGSIFFAQRQKVRRISPAGTITTAAGTDSQGSSGDGGPATSAQFQEIMKVTLDPQGNLLVADWGGLRVRRVAPPFS